MEILPSGIPDKRLIRKPSHLAIILIVLFVLLGGFVLYTNTMIANYHNTMKTLFSNHSTLFMKSVDQLSTITEDTQSIDRQMQMIGIESIDQYHSPAVLFWANEKIPLIFSSKPGGLVYATDADRLPRWIDIKPVAEHWYSFRER